MALAKRIETLKNRHSQIEEKIRIEEASHAPDDALLQQLKREKLSLKDEIARLSSELEQAA